MILYPETQARAHTKPDAVVGRARQPTFANCPHQPYIRAMVTAKKYYVGDPTPTARMRRILTRRNISFRMSLGDMIASGGESGIKEDRDGHVLYGFGHKVCVSRHVSDKSLFINVIVLSWATKDRA